MLLSGAAAAWPVVAHARQGERMRGVKGVVATSANRVDDRVSVSTTSQFKPSGPLSHLSIFVPLYELLNSLRCLKAILLNW